MKNGSQSHCQKCTHGYEHKQPLSTTNQETKETQPNNKEILFGIILLIILFSSFLSLFFCICLRSFVIPYFPPFIPYSLFLFLHSLLFHLPSFIRYSLFLFLHSLFLISLPSFVYFLFPYFIRFFLIPFLHSFLPSSPSFIPFSFSLSLSILYVVIHIFANIRTIGNLSSIFQNYSSLELLVSTEEEA